MDDRLATYLRTRRTISAAMLGEPGPDPATLRQMLTIAARVPDHGKLAPWRFILFSKKAREEAIAGLVKIAERHPDEKERKYRTERAKGFADAPLVVALNLIHAAAAYGFSAQLLTGWYAYDEEAKAWLGLELGQQVAGFLHIGTPTAPPVERDRPDVEKITTEWERRV